MTQPLDTTLGRYSEKAVVGEQVYEVHLLGVPLLLLAQGRESHDELVREFTMMALAGVADRPNVPQRLVEITKILGDRYAAVAERSDGVIDEALAEGAETVDLTYLAPAHVVESAAVLEGLLAEADEFCRAEQMLTLARSELQVRFGAWYLDEFRRQIAGQPPRRWDGPLRP